MASIYIVAHQRGRLPGALQSRPIARAHRQADELLKTSQGQLLTTNQRLFRNAVAGSEPLRCRSRRLPVIASTKMGLRFGMVLRNDLISLY
jgi:hypothetical protein